MIWVTGDHHFRHANILKYCNRDFPTIDVHDRALMNAWNNVVDDEDEVYYLGDFTLGNVQTAVELFAQLNGLVHLLVNLWHHDSRWVRAIPLINQSVPMLKITVQSPIEVLEPKDAGSGFPVVLCHYPFEVWDRKHYGAIHLHGHSHGMLHRVHNRLDVGVDMAYKLLGSYRPFSLHEAISLANGYYEEDYDGNRYDKNKE